jgi:hypothetical protein
MKLKKDKKAIEMSFDWIFALLVGAVILFLAIYFVYKISPVLTYKGNTEAATTLTQVFDPLETGSSFSASELISFRTPAKIYLGCDSNINFPFGKETVSFSDKKDKKGGAEISINNKYVFSNSLSEGKELVIFSLPFYMPFKIGDSIIMFSDNYCFYNTPNSINETLGNLNLKKINFTDNINNCLGKNIVCFNNWDNRCNITVIGDEKTGYIEKYGKQMYYSENLIYAAIFSSPEIYECNIKRLKGRFNELSKVYIEKSQIIEKNGCDSLIVSDLVLMINKNVSSSKDILYLYDTSKLIDPQNDATDEGCRLY